MIRSTVLTLSLLAALCSCETTQNNGGATSASYERPGFVVVEEDGRLWVFRAGSEALEEFRKHGEPAKCTTLIGKGPNGMTVKGPDRATIAAYLAQ